MASNRPSPAANAGRFGRLRVAVLVTAALLPTVGGCGKKDPFARQPVRGKISWKGEPIRFGTVSFEPAAGQKTGASAPIAEGAFAIPREAGPSPGNYAVWVHAFDRGADPPPGTAPGEEGPPPQEILPEQYRNSPAAQFEIRTVKDDAPNELTLDLP